MKIEPENSLNLNFTGEPSPYGSRGSPKKQPDSAESHLNGIYIYDPNAGRLVYINPGYTRLTGYTLRLLTEMSHEETAALIHPEDRKRMDAHVKKLMGAGEEKLIEIEYRLKTYDGNWTWCLSRDSVYRRNPDNSVRQIIGSLTEITNRRKKEQASLLGGLPGEDHEKAALLYQLSELKKQLARQKKRADHVKRSSTRYRELSRRSIEALEKDRQSVAKMIHDDIGASLAAIKLDLEEIREMPESSESISDDLTTLISRLGNAIKEIKSISSGLRPTTLDDLGLLATIDWYIRQFTDQNSGIKVLQHIGIEEIDIPEPIKIVVYRILQEGLTNAAIHSGADRITVRLEKVDNELDLEIEDNGKGFDLRRGFYFEDPKKKIRTDHNEGKNRFLRRLIPVLFKPR